MRFPLPENSNIRWVQNDGKLLIFIPPSKIHSDNLREFVLFLSIFPVFLISYCYSKGIPIIPEIGVKDIPGFIFILILTGVCIKVYYCSLLLSR